MLLLPRHQRDPRSKERRQCYSWVHEVQRRGDVASRSPATPRPDSRLGADREDNHRTEQLRGSSLPLLYNKRTYHPRYSVFIKDHIYSFDYIEGSIAELNIAKSASSIAWKLGDPDCHCRVDLRLLWIAAWSMCPLILNLARERWGRLQENSGQTSDTSLPSKAT